MPSPPLLEALDANHDGELDADEIAQAATRLATVDKDHDGQWSEEELRIAFPGGPGGRGGGGFGPGGPGPGGFGPGGPGPGGPGGGRTMELLDRFDHDKDGMLNQQERAKARAYLRENRPAGGMFGRGPGGPGGRRESGPIQPGRALSPQDVTSYPNAGLYDPQVLRTLFFVFDNKDWEEEMEDFYRTDVEVPATLVVDGKTYKNVGMRFRGNSSYGGIPRGKKRSLNVSIDLVDGKQRLLGYRTLNLLNAHEDPSFLRTVMFDHIARQYLPAPQANLVRVVINGESWGIYANEEQFNKDFVKHWFGESDGARWKIPPNFSGSAALVYHGDNPESYQRMYELKAKHEKQAWRALIDVCRQLQQTPEDRLETELDRILAVDRALWFLAVDNVFMDDDGYFSRGSDYCMYTDAKFGRFHLLPRDSNETFRYGGGGPGGGPGGRGRSRGGIGGDGAGERRGAGDRRGPKEGAAPREGAGAADQVAATDRPASRRRPTADDRSESADRRAERRERGPDELLDLGFDLGPGPDFGGPDFGPGPGMGGPGFGPPGFGGPGFGGPGFGGPGGPGNRGATQDPLAAVDNPMRPVMQRLMANRHLRARYLAHLRTIVEESLDWKVLGPVFEGYRQLVAEDVLSDTKNLATFAEFFDADVAEAAGGGPFGAPPGMKRFVEERRGFLLKHAELVKPRPAIVSVELTAAPQPGAAVEIAANVGGETPVEAVLLYYAAKPHAPFHRVEMKPIAKADEAGAARRYTAAIPAVPAGTEVYYYVEARAEERVGTASFHPPRAEMGAAHYQVGGVGK